MMVFALTATKVRIHPTRTLLKRRPDEKGGTDERGGVRADEGWAP